MAVIGPPKARSQSNPSVLSFYLWVGKSKWEKSIVVCETEAQNTPRKLFSFIRIKENCWEEEVCLRILESRLLLPAPVISGRQCVYMYVCVCVYVCICTESPEGCIKLKRQWGSLRRLPKFAIEGDLISEPQKQARRGGGGRGRQRREEDQRETRDNREVSERGRRRPGSSSVKNK